MPGTLLLLVKLLAVVLAVVALMLAAGCAGERALVYFPDRTVPEPHDVGLRGIEVARFSSDDGVSLCGWFAPAGSGGGGGVIDSGRALAVLVLHGNGGNVAHRAALLRQLPGLGLAVLVVDWRGYGLSDDVQPTEQGLYRDGRAALGWLCGRTGLPPSRIVLYGESLGTGVAVQLALEAGDAARGAGSAPAPYALILQAPFTSLPDAAAVHYPWLPVSLLLRDRYDNAAKIGRVTAPLLVLHGTRDGIVPVEQGRALAAAAGGPHLFVEVPAAGHNDLWRDGPARCAEIAAFLDGLR